jgi:LuxR family maltose regulon positive regulatory protein
MNLLRSKLSIPRVGRGLVPRPRVVGLFAITGSTRLVVLSAPPGFGKTSAVVDWLEADGRTAAWLSLDDADNDAGRIVPYLVAALSGTPGLSADLAHVDALDPGDMAGGLVALLEEPHAPSVLVLDDFHLIRDRSVLAIVEELVTHLPADRLLVIVTREDPPLRLSRLRAAGELVELRADQLRFTESEADAFFRRRMGLTLPTEAVHALTESTEGWPAILQLAALSLAGRPDASARAVAIAADHRLILDYITEEVLARLDPQTVEFLLQTAHLDRLSGKLCDAVTGRDDGVATLERIERANLLVVPLDEQRHWYRYHRLFAELLRIHGRHHAPSVHRAAAAWYRNQGFLGDALKHAVLVDDSSASRSLIWELGSRMLHLGEIPAVRDSLGKLPAEVAEASLEVCLLQAWACVLGRPAEEPDTWLTLGSTAAAQATEHRLAPLLPGMALMIRSKAAGSAGRLRESTELAEAALRHGLPEGTDPRLEAVYRGDGLTVLANALWDSGELNRAASTYAEALPILRAIGNWLAAAETTSNLARLELGRRRPEAALSVCDEYGERGIPSDALVLLVRCEALLALGRPEAAEVARAAMASARTAGDLVTMNRARELAASRAAGSASLPNGFTLSAREVEVLELIAKGLSNSQIAKDLFVSVGTVKTHVHAIATKLGTTSRTEAAARARDLHLVG